MRTPGWLKAHRKQVVIHASVIVVFMLFLIFVAEPLFDSLHRIPGEAQLHQLHLPAETRGLRFGFNEFDTDGHTTVGVRGWAFIEGKDSENSKSFIVLKSESRTYVFGTVQETRLDVTRHFEELGLNLDYSGFRALSPVRKLASGEYTVGIYIRIGDIEALVYTDKAMTRSAAAIELTGRR